MKNIILLEDFKGLGLAGDILLLKSGYVRNFLIKSYKVLYLDKNLLLNIDFIKKLILRFNFKKKLYLKLLYFNVNNKVISIKNKILSNIDFYNNKKINKILKKILGFNFKKKIVSIKNNKYSKNINININIYNDISILLSISFTL